MPRVTVHLPVSVELSDEQLEDARTVHDAIGLINRLARSPEVRAVARRVAKSVARARKRPPRG
jgi:hypothetical protein